MDLPKGVTERAKEITSNAFKLLLRQAKTMADELEVSEVRHGATRERIKRGPRRTNGRIV